MKEFLNQLKNQIQEDMLRQILVKTFVDFLLENHVFNAHKVTVDTDELIRKFKRYTLKKFAEASKSTKNKALNEFGWSKEDVEKYGNQSYRFNRKIMDDFFEELKLNIKNKYH